MSKRGRYKKSPVQHMIREDVAAKQAVPFADEYNQGQLSQHILKLTKLKTPETTRILLILEKWTTSTLQ